MYHLCSLLVDCSLTNYDMMLMFGLYKAIVFLKLKISCILIFATKTKRGYYHSISVLFTNYFNFLLLITFMIRRLEFYI